MDEKRHDAPEEAPHETDTDLLALQQKLAVAALMAGMVHDARNILTGTLSFSQVGRRRTAEPGSSELFESIEEDTLRCIDLFDQLLSLARGEEDWSSSPVTDLDVAPLVQTALALVRAKAQMSRVALEVAVPSMTVAATGTGVVQILLNLLINALDAAPPDGRVRIEGSVRDGEAWICVHDNGPGVAPEIRDRIFEPYFTTKKDVGTGLGLSTSRTIARHFGGELTLESSAEAGAIFCLHLPLSEEL